jgi:hypothetical protein
MSRQTENLVASGPVEAPGITTKRNGVGGRAVTWRWRVTWRAATMGLDGGHRNKDGRIDRKDGNTNVENLRDQYPLA